MAAIAGASGCFSSDTSECLGGFLCPPGRVCAPQRNTCVFPDQLTACQSPRGEGDPCASQGSAGTCEGGICTLAGAGCGNGVLDPGELCDDGNTTAGDGCAASCRSLEVCGNGIKDPGTAETCDCGDGTQPAPAGCSGPNSTLVSATCSPECTLHGCGDGILTSPEQCDGTSLGAATCEMFGGLGVPHCAMNCTVDSSTCRLWTPMTSALSDYFTSVWASSPTDVFAVGPPNLINHYDGSAWTAMSSGPASSLLFFGVWGSGPTDVFAVGPPGTILHYNGSAWSPMTSSTTKSLYSLWGTGPSDVFAVGDGTIVHYNGSTWSPMTVDPTLIYAGVWGSGPANVFAVSGQNIFHYNGSTWSMTANLLQSLEAVWGSGPTDVFAVGSNGGIVHYNGSVWSSMPTNTATLFRRVWGSGPTDVFAVGDDVVGGGTIFHYDGSAWSRMTSNPAWSLWGVAVTSPTEAFAVGPYTLLHLQ